MAIGAHFQIISSVSVCEISDLSGTRFARLKSRCKQRVKFQIALED